MTVGQTLSLVAAVKVASAIPKHTVAVARPIYGVSLDEKGRMHRLAEILGDSHGSVVALIHSEAGRLAGDVPIGRGTFVRICAGPSECATQTLAQCQ